jgi:hypothetical protein
MRGVAPSVLLPSLMCVRMYECSLLPVALPVALAIHLCMCVYV